MGRGKREPSFHTLLQILNFWSVKLGIKISNTTSWWSHLGHTPEGLGKDYRVNGTTSLCPQGTKAGREWLTCSMGRNMGFQGCSGCGVKDSTVTRVSGCCD